MPKEKGFTVDTEGFNQEMQEQRNRARAARQVGRLFLRANLRSGLKYWFQVRFPDMHKQKFRPSFQ